MDWLEVMAKGQVGKRRKIAEKKKKKKKPMGTEPYVDLDTMKVITRQ